MFKRRQLKLNNTAFNDLLYLSRIVENEQAKFLLRRNSIRTIKNKASQSPKHSLSKRVLIIESPKSQFKIFGDGIKHNSIKKLKKNSLKHKMDIDEFLVHFNLHLQMNLDHVFENRLEVMLLFLSRIESFMKEIFGSAELETRIDLMRLIIRMTNATEFIYKVFLLDIMNFEYMQYSQTLSLFVQVMSMEIGLKKK